MRLPIAFLAILAGAATGFAPQYSLSGGSSSTVVGSKRQLSQLSSTTVEPPCATPDVIPESVTAKALRAATLTGADGETVALGDKMGQGTSIVVFLRHLG